jgi:methionyl-tRNA formyltransferase
MIKKVDAGPIIKQRKIPIENSDTGLSLTKKIAAIGSDLLTEVITDLKTRTVTPITQDESKASYFQKRTPSMGRVEWEWESQKIFNYMRGLAYPFPGAFFMYKEEKFILWSGESKESVTKGKPGTVIASDEKSVDIKTGEGCFRIFELKVKGRRLTAGEFTRQYNVNVGEVLGG